MSVTSQGYRKKYMPSNVQAMGGQGVKPWVKHTRTEELAVVAMYTSLNLVVKMHL
jgi:hypothetical protein